MLHGSAQECAQRVLGMLNQSDLNELPIAQARAIIETAQRGSLISHNPRYSNLQDNNKVEILLQVRERVNQLNDPL